MFGLGPWEIGLIACALLLVLGPKRLPELAKGLGKGLREFRQASTELVEEDDAAPRMAASTTPTGEPTNKSS